MPVVELMDGLTDSRFYVASRVYKSNGNGKRRYILKVTSWK